MLGLRKISLKKCFFIISTIAIFIAITWRSEARNINFQKIDTNLTRDTIQPQVQKDSPAIKKNTLSPNRQQQDTIPKSITISTDTLPIRSSDTTIQQIDTFSLKLSKDTLDAPVNYEAEDSAVILVEDKKILLFGKTRTTHKDIILTAPTVEMDQKTNILKAIGEKDSTGTTITRAYFEQGENKFDLDTVEFNFKTQKGLTKNAFTQQSEMYVQGETIKKINNSTIFVSRGRFTTCNFDEPHFGFRANKLKVINDKVAVSGPAHPVFEDVPVPIYLPFGFYPLSKGRHSGMLQPQFTANEDFGLGLEGLGYYKVLNDYLDVTLRGNIYSYGGWSANISPTYRKRYRYQGSFNFNIQHTKFNFKGDPDYNLVKTFMISWNHSIDQRARPGTNFSASVNAGSTRHNQYIPNNPNRNFQNQLGSSISYSKTWAGKPYNFTMSANHNQNNSSRLVNLILPDAAFTVNTLYPFQRKEMVGSQKWYEKLGIGYNGVTRNQLSFYDTGKIRLKDIIDTLQWGAQHRIPISLSLPPLGPFVVSPSVSYEEKWLAQTFRRNWNSSIKRVDTVIKKGLYTDRQLTFGLGMNTAVYGTYNFNNKRLIALRHVMRPTFSFNYKPDLSKRHHYTSQIDSFGNRYRFSEFDGTLFGGYPEGQFGGISFSLDNTLEMKWRSKKDTGENAIKKIRLIDGFGLNSGYNFIADSFRLSPVQMFLRSTLFEKLNLTAQASLDPYQVNNRGFTVDRFVWQDGRFSVGRVTSGSVSLSTDFRSKPKDEKKEAEKKAIRQIDDPTLMADQQRLMDYMRQNPAEFVDFNIPWSINLSLSLYFAQRMKQDYSGFETDFNANLTFNNSFSLTPKWNFSTNGYFDFETKKLQTFTMSINREMHCWQMSIGVTPIGQYRYFNITISPKSSILQDLRINRTRYFYDY